MVSIPGLSVRAAMMAIAPRQVDRRKRLGVPEEHQERPTAGAVVRNISDSNATSVSESLPVMARESEIVQGSSPWLFWFYRIKLGTHHEHKRRTNMPRQSNRDA